MGNKRIGIINGPNLSVLEEREKDLYGGQSILAIESELKEKYSEFIRNRENDFPDLFFFQSNHEGEIIDFLLKNRKDFSALLINPGGLTHSSYSLLDTLFILKNSGILIVEVHLTNPLGRGRNTMITTQAADICIMGGVKKSYILGLEYICSLILKPEKSIDGNLHDQQ